MRDGITIAPPAGQCRQVAAAISAVREAGDLTSAGERLRNLIASELTAAAANPIPVPRDPSQ